MASTKAVMTEPARKGPPARGLMAGEGPGACKRQGWARAPVLAHARGLVAGEGNVPTPET